MRAAWWRSERGEWGEMTARERGLSRQRLDKKRLVIQCQLPRGIKAATGSGGVRARKLGKTTMTWRWPARQRNKQKGGGVWVSATRWVYLRVSEGEKGVGWACWAGFTVGPKVWRRHFSFSLFLF